MSISQGWRWAATIAAGLAAGVLAAKPVVLAVVDRTAIASGPWRTFAATGSADANLYERAAVAVAGLYALSRDETVYYTAFTDSADEPLDAACDYVVTGRALPARWWSLTLYGADHYLVANEPGIHSRHAGNLTLAPDGHFDIPVSATAQPGNWLPAPAQGAFSISARLYNPEPAVLADPGKVSLPAIERKACR